MASNLRVVTLNFWGTTAPLERRLELAVRRFKSLAPDAICLQEVRPLDGVAGRTTADEIADQLAMHAHYAKACEWQAGAAGMAAAGQEGLAILTRVPVAEVRTLALPEPRAAEARILLSVRLPTGGEPIWLHTTHLHYRLDDGIARERQVVAIDDAIRALGRDRDSAPHILCGDFNATPESDEIRFLRGLTTLAGKRTHFQDAWLRLHRECQHGDGPGEGITWSSENRMTRPLRSLDIDRRIDYMFVSSRKKDGRGTVHECRVVLAERVGQGPDEICASDHYGVLAEIQVVANHD